MSEQSGRDQQLAHINQDKKTYIRQQEQKRLQKSAFIKKMHADYPLPHPHENRVRNFYETVLNDHEYFHYNVAFVDSPILPVDVYVKRKTLKIMLADVMINPHVEQGGFYYGKKIYNHSERRWAVAIDEVIPLYDPEAHHSGFRMGHKQTHTREWEKQLINEKRLEMLGNYHSHPKPYNVFLSPEDIDTFATKAGQPYQTMLVIATEKKYAGFFFWEQGEVKRTNNSYFAFFVENELLPPEKPTRHEPNFTQFTPEYLAKKGIDRCLAEYTREFTQLANQYALLKPLKEYIPAIMNKAVEIRRRIESNSLSKEMRQSLFHDWVKSFVHAPRFPLRGDLAETTNLRKQLISALSVLYHFL